MKVTILAGGGWNTPSERWLRFDPSAAGRILFPCWRQFSEYLAALRRSPVNLAQRAHWHLHMVWLLKESRGYLCGDVHWGLRGLAIRWMKVHLPWIRTAYPAIHFRERT